MSLFAHATQELTIRSLENHQTLENWTVSFVSLHPASFIDLCAVAVAHRALTAPAEFNRRRLCAGGKGGAFSKWLGIARCCNIISSAWRPVWVICEIYSQREASKFVSLIGGFNDFILYNFIIFPGMIIQIDYTCFLQLKPPTSSCWWFCSVLLFQLSVAPHPGRAFGGKLLPYEICYRF